MSHKAPKPFYPLNIAILTVSDTRTLAEDTSGQYLEDAVRAAGHHLAARTLSPTTNTTSARKSPPG